MAGQNLGRKTSTKSKKKPVDPRVELMQHMVDEEFGRAIPHMYRCTRCGFTTTSELSKFATVYSQLYAKNNYKLSVCKDCLDELYEKVYRPKIGNDEDTVRRLCMKFD